MKVKISVYFCILTYLYISLYSYIYVMEFIPDHQSYHHVFKVIPSSQVDRLLAYDIDNHEDFVEHRDEHLKLKPDMPKTYPKASAALKDSPSKPVPPAESKSKGQPAKTKLVKPSWLCHSKHVQKCIMSSSKSFVSRPS